MLGGNASKWQVMKELWFPMKKAREKFPGKLLPSQKCSFPLKKKPNPHNTNQTKLKKKRLYQTISSQSWLGPAFLRGPHPLDVSLFPCNENK